MTHLKTLPDELVVSTRNLSKYYKSFKAVDNIELTISRGDIFGLLGPNGAGKTTIIRLLLGLVKPTEGVISVFGYDPLEEHSAVMRHVSAIVETPTFYPFLSGVENLKALALASRKISRSKPLEVLRLMGLTQHARDKYYTYSLGMKQRLAIAAALLTGPELIILDEPTNGLDPSGMAEIRQLIRNLQAEGITIFLSSHLLNEVQQVCNRIAIIQNGEIMQQGLVAELLANQCKVKVRVQPLQLKQAWETLSTSGWGGQLKVEGSFLVVKTDAADSQHINETLARQNIFAMEVIVHNQTLEEYYLSVTGVTTRKV